MMTETTEVKTEAQEVAAETTADSGVDLQAKAGEFKERYAEVLGNCLLYTSPSPRDKRQSRMPSSA